MGKIPHSSPSSFEVRCEKYYLFFFFLSFLFFPFLLLSLSYPSAATFSFWILSLQGAECCPQPWLRSTPHKISLLTCSLKPPSALWWNHLEKGLFTCIDESDIFCFEGAFQQHTLASRNRDPAVGCSTDSCDQVSQGQWEESSHENGKSWQPHCNTERGHSLCMQMHARW